MSARIFFFPVRPFRAMVPTPEEPQPIAPEEIPYEQVHKAYMSAIGDAQRLLEAKGLLPPGTSFSDRDVALIGFTASQLLLRASQDVLELAEMYLAKTKKTPDT